MSSINSPSVNPAPAPSPESKADSSDDQPVTRREKNRRFAKESRDRKNRYIKELEDKVDFLENRVMKLNLELEQYKNLLKMSDISMDKDTELNTVLKDFKSTKTYFLEQLNNEGNINDKCAETWKQILENVGTNIGPKGTIRKKVSHPSKSPSTSQ